MKVTWALAGLMLLATSASAQSTPAANQSGASAAHALIALPDGIAWQPGPPSLPAGARMVVLDGDPSKPGPFTMRLWLPAGYRISPHTHPGDERITVISGAFHVGMGTEFKDGTGTALPAGSYAALASGMAHYAYTRSETVIQLNNVGPWSLNYVNAADDPRNRK